MSTSTTVAFRRFATRIAVGVVAISMFCAAATQFVVATPRSAAFEVAPVAAIDESPSTIGVADSSLYFSSQAEVDTTLDALQALGVQNVRIQIPWAAVQAWGANSYDWTEADQMIEAAAARNMGVLAVLNATPLWAGGYLNGQPSKTAYANFASAVATRYAGKISAYEIWNEPNAAAFLSPLDPARYTELLQAAYPAIKAADPSATVIGGVVGSVATLGNQTMSPQSFIAGMYAAGAKGSFDALSFHPYHYFLPFSDGAYETESPLDQLDAIRQLMVANGDGALKIWATEYGEPTSVVTEQQQAAYLKDFLTAWQAEAGAGPVFVYTTRDTGTNHTDSTMGLYYEDWTPKLAAEVIRNFLSGNPGGTVVPSATAVNPILALTIVVSQLTGIPPQVVAAVVNMARNVVNSVVTMLQAVNTFVIGALTAITAPFVQPAQSASATIATTAASSVRSAAAAVSPVGEPAAVQSSTVGSGHDEAATPTPGASTQVGVEAEDLADAAPAPSTEPNDSPQSAVSPEASTDVAPTNPSAEPTESSTETGQPTSSSSPSDSPSPAQPNEPKPSLPAATNDESSKTPVSGPNITADAPKNPEKTAEKSVEKATATKSTDNAGSDSADSKGDATGGAQD